MYTYKCIDIQIHIYIHIYTYIHTCIYTLVISSVEIVIFERYILRHNHSVHFDLSDSYRRRLFGMVNKCAHIVKDDNV